MWALALVALRRYLRLLWQAITSPFDTGRSLLGSLLLIAAFPLLLVWQLLHWIGLALDEVLFRGYRNVEIRRPMFVIGPPRTGTTFLHQVLARDPAYTTFRTWECLFGLSVTARKTLKSLAWLDGLLGRPFGRLGGWVGRAISGPLDDIHPLGLSEPEEDFLCLMPVLECFLIVVAFPRADWLWRSARLDTELGPGERRRLLGWYRRAIQKHMYVFGEERTYLSKNASFSGMLEALLEEFPDASIITTWRDPMAAVPSQLSSLRPGLKAVGFKHVTPGFRDALTDLMHHYFVHAAEVAAANPDRVATILNDDMRERLETAVRSAYGQLGIDVSPALADTLTDFDSVSRRSQSRHRYSLDEFGLDEELIRSRFAEVYERMDQPVTGSER